MSVGLSLGERRWRLIRRVDTIKAWFASTGARGMHLDYSQASCWQDQDATIPVVDGSPIARIDSVAGSPVYFRQPVAAARPIWGADGIGTSDGVDDFLVAYSGEGAAHLRDPVKHMHVMVAQQLVGGSYGGVAIRIGPYTDQQLGFGPGGSTQELAFGYRNVGTGSFSRAAMPWTSTSKDLVSMMLDGPDLVMRINGTEQVFSGLGPRPANDNQDARLFGVGTGDNYSNMRLWQQVHVAGRASYSELLQLEQWVGKAEGLL